MEDSQMVATCSNCGSSEMEVPVVAARYAGKQIWICSGCMPVLIHKTDQLASTIRGSQSSNLPPEQ